MWQRGRFFTDGARVAGGALDVLAGFQTEVRGLARSRVERVLARLDLVPREEFEAVRSLAIRAREAQVELEARVAALEAQIAKPATPPRQGASPPRPKRSQNKEKSV